MQRAAYLILFLSAAFWGGNAVAGKLAVGHVSPMLLTAVRWGLAAVILAAIGWPRLRADWPTVRKHFWLLTGLGVLGFTVFNAALYTALNFTTAINTSIEQAGIPMIIFAANFILFRTRVTPAQILGFMLSLIGVALTASHGSMERLLALDMNFGDALMRHKSTGRAIDDVDADRLELLRELHGLVHIPTAFGPVRGGDAHEDGEFVRPHFSHDLRHLEREPRTIRK